MNKQEFKDQFITQFLAAYAANVYDNCCSNGTHEKLWNLPVVDAEFIAEQAWEKYTDIFFKVK